MAFLSHPPQAKSSTSTSRSDRPLERPRGSVVGVRFVEKGKTVVTRYNLAYINPLIFSGDNGRVLGYDNAHGEHHRHYMGQVEAVDLPGYEAALRRFQAEWQAIARQLKAERSRVRKGRKDD